MQAWEVPASECQRLLGDLAAHAVAGDYPFLLISVPADYEPQQPSLVPDSEAVEEFTSQPISTQHSQSELGMQTEGGCPDVPAADQQRSSLQDGMVPSDGAEANSSVLLADSMEMGAPVTPPGLERSSREAQSADSPPSSAGVPLSPPTPATAEVECQEVAASTGPCRVAAGCSIPGAGARTESDGMVSVSNTAAQPSSQFGAAARAVPAAEGPGCEGGQSRKAEYALLVPCRVAMKGRFPLHGTYFQTNEVFLDHTSLTCVW